MTYVLAARQKGLPAAGRAGGRVPSWGRGDSRGGTAGAERGQNGARTLSGKWISRGDYPSDQITDEEVSHHDETR